MSRSRFLFFIASTALVLPILAGSLLGAASQDQAAAGGDSLYKYLSVFTESLGLVQQTYVEETDPNTLMNAALDGITDALDPLAVYVPHDSVTSYLEARRVGTARSGIFPLRERGMIYVLAVTPGSPADEAGVQSGDLISEIQGRETRVMPVWQLEKILAGPPGTEVKLKLVRFAENVETSLKLEDFPAPRPKLEERDGVPVLTIPVFDDQTLGEVSAVLGGLGGRDKLLVDLRDTAGGDPAVAYQVGGLFASGDLGRLQEHDKPLETYTGQGGAWAGRIVVLTDRSTLGPAELLAAILRQKAGAELLGEHTFGYAGRQSKVDLSDGGVLFLADAFYTGPDFKSLDKPLQPDQRVDGRDRTFSETEKGIENKGAEPPDLILEKGIERLQKPPEPAAKKAA